MSDVMDAFELLSEALGTEVKNVIDLINESRPDEVAKLAERVKSLKTFHEKAQTLEAEWVRGFARGKGGQRRYSGPAVAQWRITFKDGTCLTTRTGADALAQFFKHIVTNGLSDPADLTRIWQRRKHRLIAQKMEDLRPDRPDLARYSREFVPGWFVSTHWSHTQVMRLMRTATETAGLVWGKDVRVEQQKADSPRDPEQGATVACIGDSLRLRKLDGSGEDLRVILSGAENRPEEGIVSTASPLGAVLEGAREGQEVEYQVGSYIRGVRVIAIEKARA